jgi:hypothetical protein
VTFEDGTEFSVTGREARSSSTAERRLPLVVGALWSVGLGGAAIGLVVAIVLGTRVPSGQLASPVFGGVGSRSGVPLKRLGLSMNELARKFGEFAVKLGGFFAVVGGLIGVALTFPQGECNSLHVSALSTECHNELGTLARDAWGEYVGLMCVGFAVGAGIGALIAIVLVQLGVVKKGDMGIDDDA